MALYRTVTFDFTSTRIKLDNKWCNGLSVRHKEHVRLIEKTVIPARTEKVVVIKCHKRNALIPGDFEPILKTGSQALYFNRSQMIPNSTGNFYITVLNASNEEIELNSGKVIGSLFPASEIMSIISLTSPSYGLDMNHVKIGDELAKKG